MHLPNYSPAPVQVIGNLTQYRYWYSFASVSDKKVVEIHYGEVKIPAFVAAHPTTGASRPFKYNAGRYDA